jgi:lipoprotein
MKKIFSKVLCGVLALACAFSFVGCGGNATDNKTYKPGDVINLSGKKAVASAKGEVLAARKILIRGIDENEFPIGGYIGPTDLYKGNGYVMPSLITEEIFKKISDCGLNYMIDTKNGINTENGEAVLNFADKYGISYYMRCDDIIRFDALGNFAEDADKMAKNLKDTIVNHARFAGPYGRDEPTSDLYPQIKKAYAELRKAKVAMGDVAKDITLYVNMFPRLPGSQLSNNTNKDYTYEQYLEDFFDCQPDYLEFDSYPVTGLENTISASWLNYLAYMNDKATEHNLAWQGFVQTGGNFPDVPNQHRIVNENEMNYDVNSMICYGAKGITYFPACYPPEWVSMSAEENCNDNSLINKYGATTARYYYAKKINANIKAMQHYLTNAVWEGVVASGEGVCNYTSTDAKYKMSGYKVLKSVEGDPSIIGCYNYNGGVALFVMNNTLTNHKGKITLNFDKNYEYEVIQRGVTNGVIAESFTLTLEAGEGALVVVK